mmetsp:Transcript_11708/g.28847  ORF Transcript_11708/g.28847 Transcript_11708/m.28847 type:complete len:88 (-) Transcript_11708:766-1029(-)
MEGLIALEALNVGGAARPRWMCDVETLNSFAPQTNTPLEVMSAKQEIQHHPKNTLHQRTLSDTHCLRGNVFPIKDAEIKIVPSRKRR